MIKLGVTVKDLVTGFKGIATSRVEYLNGCVQYYVQPGLTEKQLADGKFPDGAYVDHQRLIVVDERSVLDEIPEKISAAAPGGVMSEEPPGEYRG